MAASMANTPKKICSGRNPKAEDPNDFCRCCKGSLKVRYGDSWKWTSSENLFLPSKKKGLEGTILADVLEQKTGIVAEKISSLSARLCLICATKIRKSSEGFHFIVSTLNVVNPKFFQLRDPEVEVTNAVLQHSELRQDILKALWRRLNAEFKEYCSSDSVLKHRTPEELIAFSNSSIVEEVSTKCPFWSSCISGACGVEMKESRNVNNAIALATSVLARVRNQSMSALAYRVSSILFHSGVSSQDLIRLNRMGICMSPQMILSLQRD